MGQDQLLIETWDEFAEQILYFLPHKDIDKIKNKFFIKNSRCAWPKQFISKIMENAKAKCSTFDYNFVRICGVDILFFSTNNAL